MHEVFPILPSLRPFDHLGMGFGGGSFAYEIPDVSTHIRTHTCLYKGSPGWEGLLLLVFCRFFSAWWLVGWKTLTFTSL